MSYAEKLKSPKWQKKRLEIMSRDNFTCQYCKDEETQLQVHHLSYNGNPWEADSSQLVTLCCECHSLIEYCKKGDITVYHPYIKRKQLDGAPSVFLMPSIFKGENVVSVFSNFSSGHFHSYRLYNKEFLECAISLIKE